MAGISGSRIPLSERRPIALTSGSFQGDNTLVSGQEQEAFNITGSGVINLLALSKAGTAGFANVTSVLEIDGVEVFSKANGVQTDLVAEFDKAYPNGIPFNVSARAYISWSSSPGGSTDEPIWTYEIVEHS